MSVYSCLKYVCWMILGPGTSISSGNTIWNHKGISQLFDHHWFLSTTEYRRKKRVHECMWCYYLPVESYEGQLRLSASVQLSVISVFSSVQFVFVCDHSWWSTLPQVQSPAGCRCSLSSQSPPSNRWGGPSVFATLLINVTLRTRCVEVTACSPCVSLTGLRGLVETQSRQLCQPVSRPRGAAWESGPQAKSQAQGTFVCD